MRMCLGKILLQSPDVLLLDEPTNHLDLDAIEWLEGYVKELAIPTVIVSHDREFLDQVRATTAECWPSHWMLACCRKTDEHGHSRA
jgi:ATP-binding cassette, subfamily F, member 3